MDAVLEQLFTGPTGRLIGTVLAACLLVRLPWLLRVSRVLWRRGPHG